MSGEAGEPLNSPGLRCLILASRSARDAHARLDQGCPADAFAYLQASARYLSIAALQPPEWMAPGHFLRRYILIRQTHRTAAARFSRGLLMAGMPLDGGRRSLVW